MTTNVYDHDQKIMATDSRWSTGREYLPFVLYADGSTYDKILVTDDVVFMFSGKLDTINAWKIWANETKRRSQIPSLDGIAVCMVNKITQLVDFQNVDYVEFNSDEIAQAYFSGSGYEIAWNCWMENKNATMAIQTAKNFDVYTGGEIKYFDFNSSNHNLNLGYDVNSVNKSFEEGYIVNKENLNFGAIKDNLNHDVVKKFYADLAVGHASLQSPSPSSERKWTPEQIKSFDIALSKYYPE